MNFYHAWRTEMAEEWRLIRIGLTSTIPLSLAVIAQVWLLWVWMLPLKFAWPLGVLAYILALIGFADSRTRMLPLSLVALVAVLGVVLNLHAHMPLWQILSGALVAWIGALGVGMVSGKWAGRPALGAGDVWLASALGAVLGIIGLAPWLLAVALVGAGQVGWLVLQRQRNTPMPFAPTLIIGAWLTLLYGDTYYALVLP